MYEPILILSRTVHTIIFQLNSSHAQRDELGSFSHYIVCHTPLLFPICLQSTGSSAQTVVQGKASLFLAYMFAFGVPSHVSSVRALFVVNPD